MGEIEWYHRLRNELYHQGNGLTVERQKIEIYAELANLLFFNLFGTKLIAKEESRFEMLGSFMESWIHLESVIMNAPFFNYKPRSPLDAIRALYNGNVVTDSEMNELNSIRNLRNSIVHGQNNYKETLSSSHIDRVVHFAKEIEARLQNFPYV